MIKENKKQTIKKTSKKKILEITKIQSPFS